MRSSILIKCLVSVFLHINYVPSSIYNEVDRFTNERLSTSIETIGLPRLARALLTLIGSCRIYSVFQIKAGRFRKRYLSCNRFAKEKVLPSPIFLKTLLQTCKSNRALHLYCRLTKWKKSNVNGYLALLAMCFNWLMRLRMTNSFKNKS